MSDPLIDAMQEFVAPPQIITVDRPTSKDVGEECILPVRLVVHKKSEMGTAVYRVVEVMDDGSLPKPPSSGEVQIVPSPSA
jgi:hypothetical protein